jgi:hypothetical protein
MCAHYLSSFFVATSNTSAKRPREVFRLNSRLPIEFMSSISQTGLAWYSRKKSKTLVKLEILLEHF